MKPEKLLQRILAGHISNIAFSDLVHLVEAFGFRLDRIRGSHRIYTHPAVPEPLNLQPMDGQAKPYQIRQLLDAVERYNLGLGEHS